MHFPAPELVHEYLTTLPATDQLALWMLHAELQRARELHPNWPDDVIHRAAIVQEEAGELGRAALLCVYQNMPFYNAFLEARQTGAMALRFLLDGADIKIS